MKEKIVLSGPTYRHARILSDVIERLAKMAHVECKIQKHADRTDIEVGGYHLALVPLFNLQKEHVEQIPFEKTEL